MLEGLKVVEICSTMSGQVAGLMFSELGADVLKIEPPEGDPLRGTAGFASWNRGKRSLVCDLSSEAGMRELRDRLSGADVLVHRFTPRQAKALQLDDQSITQDFPKLVVCGVTGSPRNHPDVERSDDELLVAARLGVLYENDGHRPGPIVWRYRMGSWAAAHLAFAGIIARLIMRLQSGRGGVAHTSLTQGFLSNLPMVWARNSCGPMPNPETKPTDKPTAISMQLFQCKGGDWLQIMDPSQQFDYATLPTMWEVMAERVEIDTPEGVVEAFKRRPIEAWEADLRAADIAVEPAQPMGEVLRHPEVRANGYAIEIDDPEFGKTIQANLPLHTNAQLRTGLPAPRLGEKADAEWATPGSTSLAGTQPSHPLEGVRVLDLGMFLAGPLGPSLMGDMGANVIKLEALTGDRIRFMHRYYQAAARSKRSIAIDLTNPKARPIFERLVKWAEVVHHNMRPKAGEKLKINEDHIHQIDPETVYSYVSAYGQKGQRGNWPGYDSIFNAIAGWEFENAGQGNRPVFNRPGTMDITSAHSCLVGIMASLYAKRATGEIFGTQASLLGAAAFTQGERLIGPEGELTETCRLNTEQTGFSHYHRIFATKDDWVAVAAHAGAERAALRSVLGKNEDGFAAAAATFKADDLLAELDAAGVPCDRVVYEDALNQFFDDPLNRELGLVSALEQPEYGLVEQPGEFWHFGDTEMDVCRAAPRLGQHTDEIMREIGYSDEEIVRFRDERVIG
jgi:crotonobetainyl-CoA:carnitine CoA-transferase CaiB-like acyl-CoA transferase